MRIIVIVYLLILFVNTDLIGQLLADKVMPPSPNAAAIIKYCDHPVSIKTGIPKIKYDFQTLINKDLFVPITFNYNSIGIKVEEEATWTGLGWYLNAGGMITRIVRGKNDFGLVENDLNQTARGYPFEHIKPCYDDCEENETAQFHEKVCNGEIDTDPDIFFFDILGNRGKFFLEPDHNENDEYITINIVKPYKMTFKYNIKENYWDITDVRNYKYVFKTKELTETHRNYFDHKLNSHKILFKYYSDLATTAWYLDKIISPSGIITFFNYDVSPQSSKSTYGSNGTHHRMNINDEDIWDIHYSSYCFPDKIENVQVLSESIFNDIYLESISSGDYRADFIKSPRTDLISPSNYDRDRPSGAEYSQYLDVSKGPQKLDAIEIRKNGVVVNEYKFHYSYFNNDTKEPKARLNKRLRLDSLTRIDGDKSKTDIFQYHQNYNLPSKESHARDLWGYFNGEENLYNTVPSDYFNYSQPEKTFEEEGRARHYSLEHVKEAVLEKITYGSGFERTFKYGHQEFNFISKEIQDHIESNLKKSNLGGTHDPFISGGLRIEEIIDVYPTENVYKEYHYAVDKKEVGELSIIPYSHENNGYDHKTAGNHGIYYKGVWMKRGKIFNGVKF